MNKLFFYTIITFFIFFVPINTFSNTIYDLQSRLEKIKELYVVFNQKIINNNGILIQEGVGEVWIKKPNLFHCHLIKPDESFLISNGKILWIYNPALNQVNIKKLQDFNINTLLMFITSQKNLWKKYKINKIGDIFTLIPKYFYNNLLKKIVINITATGIIHKCSMLDKNYNLYDYKFTKHKIKFINIKKFNFIPPKGTIIDN